MSIEDEFSKVLFEANICSLHNLTPHEYEYHQFINVN